jgi:hypothetical protein
LLLIAVFGFSNLGAAEIYCQSGSFICFDLMLNAEKRPTRQWAAWTRQEEESFFTALRQVGKACNCWNVIWINSFSILFHFLTIVSFHCRTLRKLLTMFKVKTRIR